MTARLANPVQPSMRQAFSGALSAPENARQPMIDLIQVARVRGGCPAVTPNRHFHDFQVL